MIRALVVLRPEPGCSETIAAAHRIGLAAIGAPLFAIEPVAWEPPVATAFDGILAGSANAFLHGGSRLADLVHLPVLAVGERTAEAARNAGFAVETVGKGGLQPLLDACTPPRNMLRLGGAERVALVARPGIAVTERVVYRAVPLPLAPEAVDEIAGGAVVLLHSGEAARRFSVECARLSIDRQKVRIAALAPRVALAVGSGWRVTRVAPEVTDAALLALAADMCH